MYMYRANMMLSQKYKNRTTQPFSYKFSQTSFVPNSKFHNDTIDLKIGRGIINGFCGGLFGHIAQYGLYFVGINLMNNMMPGAMHFDLTAIYKEMFRVKERRVTMGIAVIGAIVGNMSNVYNL